MAAFGKLPPEILARLLAQIPRDDPTVVAGPRIGEDAAVLEIGDRYLVAACDPITLAGDRIGWYSVEVNANDVATMGARPRWFLATLLLPRRDPSLAQSIFEDLLAACRARGVTLCGGHTEITRGLDRPIIAGTMLGEVEKNRLVRKENLRPGDAVLLTRGVALEGTAILAREKTAELAGRVEARLLASAQELLYSPGISVVEDALAAAGAAALHAMHDPTEGGLIGGLAELAAAARVGLAVERACIPVLPETEAICAALGLDPLRLIASGALLIAVAPDAARPVMEALAARGTPVAAIGTATAAEQGLRLDGVPFSFPEHDEISRAFA